MSFNKGIVKQVLKKIMTISMLEYFIVIKNDGFKDSHNMVEMLRKSSQVKK